MHTHGKCSHGTGQGEKFSCGRSSQSLSEKFGGQVCCNAVEVVHADNSCCIKPIANFKKKSGRERSKHAFRSDNCSYSPIYRNHFDHIPRTLQNSDLEQVGASLEHVVLKFHGPDCAGCANKIFKFLTSIPALHNLRKNNLLLQAEFDLDISQVSAQDIISWIRKTVGYRCQRITKRWQELEAIMPEGAERIIAKSSSPGVKDVVFTGKNNVSVQYDVETIGARDLLKIGFGVPLQLAPLKGNDTTKDQNNKTARLAVLSAVLTVPILVLSWAPFSNHRFAYNTASFVLATMVQIIVAGPLYPSALRTLFIVRAIDMDLLVVLSTSTAYIASVVSYIYQSRGIDLPTGMHFETSALLITLIMIGRLIAAYACQRAVDSASVRSLQITTAFVVNPSRDGNFKGEEMDTRLLQPGDIFKLEANCPVATDGIVISGTSDVDESMITGESTWVGKRVGSSVIAGSINRSGTLLIQLTRVPGSNTITDIADMVDEVNYSKPKVQEIADRVAGYFVPGIAVVALTTLFVWFIVAKSVTKQTIGEAILTAIPYAISVLVVSCPCALGLAVPMVTLIGSSIGVKHGIVVRSAEVLQLAKSVTHVVFDKTGTLTENRLVVSVETYVCESSSFTASLVLGLTTGSQHPVASTVAGHLMLKGHKPALVGRVRTVVGKGIAGTFNRDVVRIGSSHWLGVEENPTVKSLLSQGFTVMCVTKRAELLAIFGLSASFRKDVCAIVSELRNRKIDVSIVSGDNAAAVHQAAIALQVPLENTRYLYSPTEKQEYVETLMQRTKRSVVFCGDGTNDAAALAQAHIGVCISSEVGVAHSAANVVFMRPALNGILTLIDLSKDTSRRIYFNFIWSAVYNTVAILFAAGAFVNVRLPLEYAGIGEAVSVLPLVIVALQMKCRRLK